MKLCVSLFLHAIAFCRVNATAGDCTSLVYHTYDGECVSLGDALWGRAHEAHFLNVAKLHVRSQRIKCLPTAHLVSNLLCTFTPGDAVRQWKTREVMEFSTIFGQFRDHDPSAALDEPLKRFYIRTSTDGITFAGKRKSPVHAISLSTGIISSREFFCKTSISHAVVDFSRVLVTKAISLQFQAEPRSRLLAL